jgi:hypothetical protein
LILNRHDDGRVGVFFALPESSSCKVKTLREDVTDAQKKMQAELAR